MQFTGIFLLATTGVEAVNFVASAFSNDTSAYVPQVVSCPAVAPQIRTADSLSRNESSWVAARKPKANAAMYSWLKTLNLSSTDLQYYQNNSNSSTKNVDIAISGGGYRSLLIGAGVIEALDARENQTNASLASPLAGFLQGTTYLSGLSGGAWLVSSIIGNNYSMISTLQASLWRSSFTGGFLSNSKYPNLLDVVSQDVDQKSDVYEVSINDPWGRLLSYQFLNGTDGGVTDTLSGVVNVPHFQNHTMPFPIMQALGTLVDQCGPDFNATQYEFSPYEFGSWDQGVKAFTPTKYIGSPFSNSTISNTSACVTGFDNLGFVLGTSSCLFSTTTNCAPIRGTNASGTAAAFGQPLRAANMIDTGADGNDALYPNPFYNRSLSPLVKDRTQLTLVDGGLANQNNPLWSLIQPVRNASLILTVDNSADIASGMPNSNFPNGSELLVTYQQTIRAGLPFPVIPPVSVFLSKNLTRVPTLFGCDNSSVPTILYLANAQHGAFPANQSTGTLTYKTNETDAMILNGFRGMTQSTALSNTTASAAWAKCLGCFVIYEGKRSNATTNATSTATRATTSPRASASSGASAIKMSTECASCFNQYCYN